MREPVTFLDGRVQLWLGDCREALSRLPLASVDSFITDPPYGISLQPQRELTKPIQGDGRAEAMSLWFDMLEAASRLAKPDTAHLFWAGWSEADWTKALLAARFTVKSCIVWRKNMWGIGYYTRPQHEISWYCHKGNPPLPKTPVSDVWEVAKVQAPIHSCEKPVDLMRLAVDLCAPDNALVVDPFMGVGATGIAAVKMGRRFIGVEIDPEHFAVAVQRIGQAVEQPDLFLEAPQAPVQATLGLEAAE